MGTILVFLGVFLYCGVSIINFVFLTSWSDKLINRLRKSVEINLSNLTKKAGPEFGLSLMKVTGILWVIIGLIMKFIGGPAISDLGEEIVLGVIILTPVWIGAFIAERRRK